MTHPALDVDHWDDDVTDPSVIIADGSFVKVTVREGCLLVSDGVPSMRRERKIPRIGHPLATLVNLGHVGYTTYEAQRWMHELGIRYAEVGAGGELMASNISGTADWKAVTGQVMNPLPAFRFLIRSKLEGQARYLENLGEFRKAKLIWSSIAAIRDETLTAKDISDMEAQSGQHYWPTWGKNTILPWHPRDLRHIPGHWTYYNGRRTLKQSKIAVANKTPRRSNRYATDPVNAMLNYGYTVGATACYTACYAYGLHPSLGISHTNRDDYDAFVWDLIEAIRPRIDELVSDYISSLEWFLPEWCHELPGGQCELDPPVTHVIAGWSHKLLQCTLPYARKVRDLLKEK